MEFKNFFALLALLFGLLVSVGATGVVHNPVEYHSLSHPIIADHSTIDYVRLDQLTESVINDAKSSLHIAYGHTSHGSQVITGMNGLDAFKGSTGLYSWSEGGSDSSLDIDDVFVGSTDLGNSNWDTLTDEYLQDEAHNDVNVVMWSWCGQVSSASEEYIDDYLADMSALELKYPEVTFVYMTGHTDGTGLDGNLHVRNEQIRAYCLANNKVLYDFADIEQYNPDMEYFGDKNVTDSCKYDKNGDGDYNDPDDGNWALEWQTTHEVGVDWYQSSSAHSEPLNANQKAYAAWWLWARLGGWESTEVTDSTQTSSSSSGNGSLSESTVEEENTTPGFLLVGLFVSMAISLSFRKFNRG